MSSKWTVDELREGQILESTFWANPVDDSGFRFRATHLDGRRAPKVVLCDDPQVKPGVPCRVKIKTIRKKDVPDRGSIEVEFVETMPFELKGIYLDPVVSKKVQVCLESGLNILLDGPQGSGKTVMTREIARALGMEFVFFNCAAVIEATDFLATIQVRASESGAPTTDFVKTTMLHALEEALENPGRRYLVFLDELNRCQESARNALMPALDSTRRVFNPITNQFIEIPDNVQFIAAVNRGSQFSGTFSIDAAQLDRFAPIQIDYLPAAEEVKLLHARHPEIGESTLRIVVEVANRVRSTPDVEGGLSVRATEEVCIYLKHPLFESDRRSALPEILKSSFSGRFDGRWNDVNTDAGVVWSLIERALEEHKKGAR